MPECVAIVGLGIVIPNGVRGSQGLVIGAGSDGSTWSDAVPAQGGPRATSWEIPQGHRNSLVAIIGEGERVLPASSSDCEGKIWLVGIGPGNPVAPTVVAVEARCAPSARFAEPALICPMVVGGDVNFCFNEGIASNNVSDCPRVVGQLHHKVFAYLVPLF